MIFVPKFGVPKKHRDPVVLWRSTANVNRKGLGCGKTLWQHKNRLVFAQPSRRPKGTSKQIWCRSYVKPTTYGQPAARETANQSRYHKGDAHPRALRLQLGHVEVTGSICSCLGMNARPWNTEIESENGSSHIICTAIEWSLPNDLARRTSTDNVNISKWAREAKLPGSQTSRLFSKKSNRSVFEHRNHWWLTIHNQLYIAVNLLTVNHLPKRSIWKKIGIFGLLAFSRRVSARKPIQLYGCPSQITETDVSATVCRNLCTLCLRSAGFLWQQAENASSVLGNISIWISTPLLRFGKI